MTMIAYVSSKCPNCDRFLLSARNIPSIAASLQIVDLDTHRPPPFVTAVPTLRVPDGRILVGTKAFEFIQERANDEVELGIVENGFGWGGGSTLDLWDLNAATIVNSASPWTTISETTPQ